jgi:tetratricopeptide (TPR) repeat protein
LAAALLCATLFLVADPHAVVSPPPGASLSARAHAARLRGDLATARSLYEQALRQDAENLNVTLELAETLRAMGESPAAENLLLRLIASLPRRPEPRRALVLAYIQNGKTSEALEQARRAVELEPENVEGHLCLGSALRAAGRPADAIAEFQIGARRSPPDARALHGLALAFAAVDDPRAREAFEKALTAAPKNLAARLDYVRYLWQLRDFDGGNREMERVLRAVPADTKLRAEYGLALTNQGRFVSRKRAAEELKKAWEGGEHEYEVALFLGASLGQMGDFDEAVRWLRQAIAIDPEKVTAHISLGQVLLLQQKPPEAVSEFERAAVLKPDSAQTQLDLGSAYEAAKDLDSAERGYRKALELDAKLDKAHYRLGTLLARTGRREEGAKHIGLYQAAFQKEQETALRGGSRRAELNLGWVELRDGRAERALEQFDRYPNDPEALQGAAKALFQLGRDADALQKYERAVALAPDDLGLRYEFDREYARVKKK